MDLGLNGRGCVITGGTRGIGAAVADALREEGARVLVVARGASGRDGLSLDVTAPDAAERIVAAARQRFGGIDVLVNNAGTSFARPLDELSDADWNGQWELLSKTCRRAPGIRAATSSPAATDNSLASRPKQISVSTVRRDRLSR